MSGGFERNSYRMPANMETAGEYMARTLPEIKETLQKAVNSVITRRSDNPLVEVAHEIMRGEEGNMEKLHQNRVRAMAENGSLFDAHCHYLNFKQKTEGIEVLLKCMDNAGIGMAALTGCPLKKSWVGTDMSEGPPEHALYDDGDLYYYSLTDALVAEDLQAGDILVGSKAASRLCMLACGFNLGDFSIGAEAERMLKTYPGCKGFGELILQSDDLNNLTLKGGNWTYLQPAMQELLRVAGSKPRKLPLIFYSEARSVSTKPYRATFEYVPQVEELLEDAAEAGVNCLWVGGGASVRGQWNGYVQVIEALFAKHANLYISLTPEILLGKVPGITREMALGLAQNYHERIVLGTTVRGIFETNPPAIFGDSGYKEQSDALVYFAAQVKTRCGTKAADNIRYLNAAKLYHLDDQLVDLPPSTPPELKKQGSKTKKNLKKLMGFGFGKNLAPDESADDGGEYIRKLAYGGGGGGPLIPLCPPSRAAKEWRTIDCHLHLLDFLQKSSGTQAAKHAMDGCGVSEAVVFGMPCCKKWCFYRPDQPLYYQDDNGPCYVYAYADQMVADAWLALSDKDRARFAPCFASFDPTDCGAIQHVRRMYEKYPKMWRAVGEVMCRHDDLTTMLLGKEVPRINHPGLNLIYEFCIEVDLPILIHHNADRVGDNDGKFSYVHEVDDVLTRYPKLKMTWVHAGASRRCTEPNHYEMIDTMLTKFPNLSIDISWVVWEDVICEPDGTIKPEWIACIEKHNTKFYIGSDNVAQYFPINDLSTNLLAMNITKYWPLFDKLTPEAGENVAWRNAHRAYFEKWDVPTGEGGERRYMRNDAFYDTECLDPPKGAFGKLNDPENKLADGGKY